MSFVLALILAVVGVPLFAVMAFSALVGYWQADLDPQGIIISFYQLTDLPLLSSLPLFAFSGYLMARSDAPNRLLRISEAFVGWLPGGLAIVAIWACTVMTALTGASGVTIVALGGLLLPALLKDLYRESFSLGLVTMGGSFGLLFPPSLPVILYGVVAETSIEQLFIAGILPGILILSLLSLYAGARGVRDRVPRTVFSARELYSALREGIWEAPLPVFLVVGIYSGSVTVDEAAVVATAYLLIIEVLVYRDVKLREIGAVARDSTVLVGGILIILGMTMAVTNYIVTEEVPQRLFEQIREHMTSKLAFLISLNLFLLLVGCMVDIFAAIALIVPLMVPIAAEYDVHPVHLGIVFLTNMAIGYATPPVGMNLFIASVSLKQPVLKLYWAAMPFIVVLLVALGIITYFPWLSLVLLGG